MKHIIDGVDFHELEAQKYWVHPSSYSADRKKTETQQMIFSGDYIGARKMDGAFYKFVKDEDGGMELIGRSKGVGGDYLDKIDWVPQLHDFFSALPNGTCLLGEIYFPDNEGSKNTTTIMGCGVEKARDRQEKGPKLYYYVFDVLAYGGCSLYKEPIEVRVNYIENLKTFMDEKSFVKLADYREGADLWNHLQTILGSGGEGIVITKKGTCYQPGKRPARQTLKVKKELRVDIDAFIIGANPPTRLYSGKEVETWQYYVDDLTNERLPVSAHYKEFNEGKSIVPVTKNYYYGWAGSLKLGLYDERGEVYYLGDVSGLTEEVKENWKNYLGKVCVITGMEIWEGHIRHPKFVEWRSDKKPEECLKSQVF